MILRRPLKCRQAFCGASCCIADAEFWGSDPSKCPNYEYRKDLYDKHILEKARKEIENIEDFEVFNGGLYVRQYDVIRIIDKYTKGDNK